MTVSRADRVKALEYEWWRRVPRMLWRPREVFAELRDDSDETAAALSEPMVAVTFLAGIAMFFATTTAGQLYDDNEFDWMLVGVEAIVAGALVALQNYWIGGAALLLGLRSFGSMARYRTARHIIGLSTVPFVLALLVVWPVRIAIFGTDLFRSGGSDEGTTGVVLTVIDATFAAWALGLVVVGVRVVEGWSWPRAIGAASFAAALFALLVAAAVLR
jgi:hypothetical protein